MPYIKSLFEKILEIFWPQRSEPVVDVRVIESQPPEPQAAAPSKPDKTQCVEWRLTEYYLADSTAHKGDSTVPIIDNTGATIDLASAGFFSSLALEGSGVTKKGKLVNVSGKWLPIDPAKYQVVWDYHKKYLSKRAPSYSGLQVVNDHVTKVLAFYEVPKSKVGSGYGVCNGISLSPYRTLAADIGKGKKSDPKFKSAGGVVPLGTRVYILEFDGAKLPDGTTHDGWFVVNDTGGGIFGAHFDVFVGRVENKKVTPVPRVAYIWFEGADKLPIPYVYGLKDS